jgi:hypothetical protein
MASSSCALDPDMARASRGCRRSFARTQADTHHRERERVCVCVCVCVCARLERVARRRGQQAVPAWVCASVSVPVRRVCPCVPVGARGCERKKWVCSSRHSAIFSEGRCKHCCLYKREKKKSEGEGEGCTPSGHTQGRPCTRAHVHTFTQYTIHTARTCSAISFSFFLSLPLTASAGTRTRT